MKIRSLLLGSVAAAGLATTGFAADLGVVTSLDVCDELGLSGLTISSDDNCLVITGGVSFEYSIGDYEDDTFWFVFSRVGFPDGIINIPVGDASFDDEGLDVDAWLKFVATADSDFGPASATIKLLAENYNGTNTVSWILDEAWVGIGDTTMIMAGKKGSIFNDGDDAPLNYLGLYNSSDVDVGVGFADGPATGGGVLQIVHNLGNGVSIGGALENLGAGPTAVGVLAFAGDGLSAHVSGAASVFGGATSWKLHAGFTGTWDPIKVVGAVATDDSGWWNVLGSASATFDMFTLAISGEADSEDEWGVGGSASATVSDGITINLGARYFDDVSDIYQVEAGLSAAVSDTLTVTAAAGTEARSAGGAFATARSYFYGKAGLAWAPGGGFTASVEGYANTEGALKATFKAAKDIK